MSPFIIPFCLAKQKLIGEIEKAKEAEKAVAENVDTQPILEDIQEVLDERKQQQAAADARVHAHMRSSEMKFLLQREEDMERAKALAEEEEAAKQAERTTLIEALEKKSLLRMQKAEENLHNLLMSQMIEKALD